MMYEKIKISLTATTFSWIWPTLLPKITVHFKIFDILSLCVLPRDSVRPPSCQQNALIGKIMYRRINI